MLYVICSPFSKHIYAGFTGNLRARHNQHFLRVNSSGLATQLPAYEVMRAQTHIAVTAPCAGWFIFPVAATLGTREHGLQPSFQLEHTTCMEVAVKPGAETPVDLWCSRYDDGKQ